MAKAGWDVSVISMLTPLAYSNEIRRLGIPLVSLDLKKNVPDPRVFWRLVQTIRDWKPEVMHCHQVHANIAGRLARMFSTIPVVVCTAHNITEGPRWREWAYRATDSLCDLTTNVCKAGVDRYIRVGAAPANKICFMPNGVEAGQYSESILQRGEVRAKLGLGDAFVWLAVGNLREAKDYETMLEAFRQVLTVKSEARLLIAGVHALEQYGFEMIDAIQTFSLHLDAGALDPGVPANFETRLFRDEDLSEVVEIARSSYIHDRLHADSSIGSPAADRINEEWLRNSCSLQAADAVVVAVEEGAVLGYVTCKIDHETRQALGFSFASIVMVATRQQARGRGVAQACTSAALDWFRTNDVDIVEVGTQLSNIAAARLYEKNGFRMAASSFTLRRILGARH